MPKRAFTDAVVKNLKAPAEGQVEIFDQGYPGLALRISYGGREAWTAFYRRNNKLHRAALGVYPAMTLAQAREAWRQIRSGSDPIPAVTVSPPAIKDPFAAVAAEWLKRDQAENRSFAIVRRIVERELIPAWGDRPIGELGRRDMLDLIDGIVDRGTPVMARRVHAYLHRLFRWSVGRGIIEVNPMANLPMAASEKARDRVLTDQELAQIWNAASGLGFPYGSAIQLLALTGGRREEIGQLKWSEVDGDTIKLPGERTKTGAPHMIMLSAPARALLDSLPRVSGSQFVFTAKGSAPISGWGLAKRNLDSALPEISPPWRLHDIRRTVATGLQKLGVPLTVTEAVLGHKGGSRGGIVGVYQRHEYADEKRAALASWGVYVVALIEGKAPGKVVPMVRAS